jgi:DNA polymerase-3 subunit epsilon
METLLESGFVAVDLETTGLDPRGDAIVSMAAIPFVHGRPAPGFVSLVNPGRPIPPDSTRVHGIDDERVRDAPPIERALSAFDAVCADRVIVGHDVSFDVAFLARARGRRVPAPHTHALDTRRLAVALEPSWRPVAELETVATHLGLAVVGRHTSDGDARLAAAILLALLPRFRVRGARTVSDLVWAQNKVYRRT